MDDSTPIPFDQFQRYGVTARAVERLRKNGQRFNILEVGANSHKLLGRLLPNDRIIYLDREIPQEMQKQEDIIVGDATELSLADGSFDIVVALDVFEHIPKERREAFLRHTCRTARLATIIGAPFDFPSVVAAEREAANYWNTLFDHPYRWLFEHAENGLPNLDCTTQAISSLGYHFHTLKHGDISLWIAFIKGHFAKEYVNTLRPVISMYDCFYKEHLFEQDFSPSESYRQFIFSSHDVTIIQALKDLFDNLSNSCDQSSNDFQLELLKLLPSVATEKSHIVTQFNGQIAQRDAQLAELLGTRSWKMTRPFRFVGRQARKGHRIALQLPMAINHGGGFKAAFIKTMRLIKREGLGGVKLRLFNITKLTKDSPPVDKNDYTEWVRRYDSLSDDARAAMHTRIEGFSFKPLISMIMTIDNPTAVWLIDAIDSVHNQIYPHWELCLSENASTDQGIRTILERYAREDARIKIEFREQNDHISEVSNRLLLSASGEWTTFLKQDDILSECALYRVTEKINMHPDASLVYADEDKIDVSGKRIAPYFKCDWNQDMFYSHNFINASGIYQTKILRQIGGFTPERNGDQIYDLALRYVEQIDNKQIHHIPYILHHSRIDPSIASQSGEIYSTDLLAGEKALNEHFQRQGTNAIATLNGCEIYRIQYALPKDIPLVSIIILTKNRLHLVKQCVESIFKKTNYSNYEILIIDNGSDEPETLLYLQELESSPRVRIIRDNRPFNFSALNNVAVKLAHGSLVCLLNNDVEVISPDWLSEMVSHSLRPDVGAVGAKLWYPNDTLQHGGVITGINGVAGHAHKNLQKGLPGYQCRDNQTQNLSAVTAACLVIRKSVYEEVGGLNETELQVAFNDVDFCLRLCNAGYRNIWTPYAELYHHESATRGTEDTRKKYERFVKEVAYMKQRWGNQLLCDPAYSPNLSLDSEDFSLAWPPRVLQCHASWPLPRDESRQR